VNDSAKAAGGPAARVTTIGHAHRENLVIPHISSVLRHDFMAF
jgi:hypothetical protein